MPVVRQNGGLRQPLDEADHRFHPEPPGPGVALLLVLVETDPDRWTTRVLLLVEEPDREDGQQPTVDQDVLTTVSRVDEANRLEEDRDTDAHPNRERHLEIVRIDAQLVRVPR